MNKAVRRLAWVVIQAVLIALITFVLTEITFRIYGHFQPTFIFHGSSFSRSYNTYRGKPNSPDYESKLNSHGFKGKDYTIAKPPNTYRIIAIGDSFTFGVVPYRYNYVNLVEQQLNRRLSAPGGRTYEVINMGISATGPRDYLTLLADEGVALHPDMLILSFFIGNDIIEAQRNDVQQDYRLKQPWYRSSYVLSFLNYVFTVTRKFEGTIRDRKVYDDNEPSYPEDAFLEIQRTRLQNFVKQDAEFLNAFRVQMGYLQQIQKICERRNIKLLVVLIPDEMQVNKPQLAQVMKRAGRTAEQVDLQQPNQLIARDFAANGIACIDLLPEFARCQETLYKPRNTHWNIAGNRLAAELITPKVMELLQQK